MKTLKLLTCVLLVKQFGYSQEHGLINNSKSPYAIIKTVDFGACQWTNGFWKEKTDQCVEVMTPYLGYLMETPEEMHFYENFLVAAGLKEGEFKGWSFSDGDFYKYVEALTNVYGLTKSKKIDQHLDSVIAVIAKAQRSDGYIHTMIQIGHGINGYKHSSERTFSKKNDRFTRAGDHEFYNFGHLMTAACVHYRITGKTNFLDIAKKASDMLYAKFKVSTSELAALNLNDTQLMGLVEMYRTTGDKKYLELAMSFLNGRGTAKDSGPDGFGLDYAQNRTPFRQETEAVGHAVMANYLYAGVADIYAETGDKELLGVLEKIWQNVVTKKMYVTGATGTHHFGLSKNRDKVAESFGKDFELPSIGAYNESCSNIGNGMWNWRMFLASGEARFVDQMELTFYNSAITGMAQDGEHYFYTNPLRHLIGNPNNTKDSGMRSPWLSVFCCPPNMIRTISEMSTYGYTTSEKAIWVNLYGSNVFNTKLGDGTAIRLTQQTDYPWNGLVTISVDGAFQKEFSLKLRIPGWASSATVKVNGKPITATLKPGTYFDLKRAWSKGDVVELNIPMNAVQIEANPFVEATLRQVAIKRGPIVYCLESVDLPNGIDILEVNIPADIKLIPHYDKNLLGGITVLSGEAVAIKEKDWTNQLYRPVTKEEVAKVPIQLIPYYTWANRGKADMTVWLPQYIK